MFQRVKFYSYPQVRDFVALAGAIASIAGLLAGFSFWIILGFLLLLFPPDYHIL